MTLLVQQFAPRTAEATREAWLVNARNGVARRPISHDLVITERFVVPAHPGATVAERHEVPDLVVSAGVHDAGGYR